MKEIKWVQGHARFWNSLPDWIYPMEKVLTDQTDSLERTVSEIRSMAVELDEIGGGAGFYGALGATFIPDDSKTFHLQVAVAPYHDLIVPEPLARYGERLYRGFPEETSEGFVHDILSFPMTQQLGSGVLRFDRGLYLLTASTSWSFRTVGRIVVCVLSAGLHTLSHEELEEICQREKRNIVNDPKSEQLLPKRASSCPEE